MTRDWSQFTMRMVVAYDEDSDRIVSLLLQEGEELRQDLKFEQVIVSEILARRSI